MITYTWNILKMDVLPQIDGYTDVVVTAEWSLTGVDGEYSGAVSAWQQFNLPQGEGFTPYNQLTEQQVIGWVQEKIGQEDISLYEKSVASVIQNKKTPPPQPEPMPLPWA